MGAALKVTGLSVVYGAAIEALEDVSLVVPEGGFIALLGANGAGKSTMLKAISGLLRFENGRARQGKIEYNGEDISAVPSTSSRAAAFFMSARGASCSPA